MLLQGGFMVRYKTGVAVLTVSVLMLTASVARAQQSVNIQLGLFVPRGEGGRIAGDVLNKNQDYLLFGVSDFNGFTGGIEWLVPVGSHLEAGIGVGFFQREVPTTYWDWTNDDGSEIQQRLKLRTVPVSATLKYLPLGARRGFQPYIGIGVAMYLWKYSETGDFIDFNEMSVFNATYTGSGTSFGPLATLGVRGRISSHIDLGAELRWQWGSGNLSTNDFLSSKIDRGGFNALGPLRYRF
jgi:opacity protein-like surface antigen